MKLTKREGGDVLITQEDYISEMLDRRGLKQPPTERQRRQQQHKAAVAKASSAVSEIQELDQENPLGDFLFHFYGGMLAPETAAEDPSSTQGIR